jgi:molybdenum cofactor guanylyltransferase
MYVGMILAGGEGLRLGGNKPFHLYEGKALIHHVIARLRPQVDRLLINAGVVSQPLTEDIKALGEAVIFDDLALSGLGPLSGVLSGLEALGEDEVLITAPCDMPQLPNDMVERLIVGDEIAYFKGKRDYPLCAKWPKSALTPLKDALLAAKPHGGLRVMDFLGTQSVRFIEVIDDDAFININKG